jgi:hypothetical protein
LEDAAAPTNYLSELLPFDNLRNVDIAASTHRALPRLHFAFVNPFISTLQAYPLCHASSLPSNLGIYVETLNFFHHKEASVEKTFWDWRLQCLLPASSADLTTTFFGTKDIFLPHLGHLPS